MEDALSSTVGTWLVRCHPRLASALILRVCHRHCFTQRVLIHPVVMPRSIRECWGQFLLADARGGEFILDLMEKGLYEEHDYQITASTTPCREPMPATWRCSVPLRGVCGR